jgi:enterochelin esterase-like enzyme
MKKNLLLIAVLALCAPVFVLAQGSRVYETRTVKSEILNMDRRYAIYLPAGYDESDQSYPVLYLSHGGGDNHTGWVQFGQVQHIADRAIAEGLACPMIIVMPDATNVGGGRGANNANANVKQQGTYDDFFFKELIPHIEKTYRVRADRRYRAVSGLSMGGRSTVFFALQHPDIFAAAAPLSCSGGAQDWDIEQFKQRNPNLSAQELEDSFNKRSIGGIIRSASADDLKKIKSVRWYISCGDEDPTTENNCLMHIAFRKNEIPHEYRSKDGGHTWTYWRMELPLVMEFVSKSFTQF